MSFLRSVPALRRRRQADVATMMSFSSLVRYALSRLIRLIRSLIRFAWLILVMTWWLIVLGVTSTALIVRSRRHLPAHILDAGEFVRDEAALHWRDQST